MLASNITNGADPKLINIMPEEVSKCRKTLRQKISVVKENLEKEKKTNETKQTINKKVNNKNGGQANKTKTRNVCGKYVNYTCWKGRSCTLEHPVICEADIYIEYPVGRPRVTSITHKFATQIGTTKYVSGGQNASLDI